MKRLASAHRSTNEASAPTAAARDDDLGRTDSSWHSIRRERNKVCRGPGHWYDSGDDQKMMPASRTLSLPSNSGRNDAPFSTKYRAASSHLQPPLVGNEDGKEKNKQPMITQETSITRGHVTSETASGGNTILRQSARSAQIQQPGAVAVAGLDGETPSFQQDVEQEDIERQDSLAQADMVNDAELVVYARSVAPDETVKMRQRIKAIGGAAMLLVLLVIGLAIGLTLMLYNGPTDDPKCVLPVEEQDVFDHCHCSNTTENLDWSPTEQNTYRDLQALLLNRTVISKEYSMNSLLLD